MRTPECDVQLVLLLSKVYSCKSAQVVGLLGDKDTASAPDVKHVHRERDRDSRNAFYLPNTVSSGLMEGRQFGGAMVMHMKACTHMKARSYSLSQVMSSDKQLSLVLACC